MLPGIKSTVRVILPFLGAVLIVTLLFRNFSFEPLREAMEQMSYAHLFFALVVLYTSHVFTIARWKRVLELGGHTLPLRRVAFAYLANLPITKVTPTYSGDFGRAFFIKSDVPLSRGAGGVFLEAVLDISVLVFSAIVGAWYVGGWLMSLKILAGVSALVLLIYASRRSRLVSKFLRPEGVRNFFDALQKSLANQRETAALLILTVCAWMGSVLFYYLVFRGLGVHVSLMTIAYLQPIATLAGLLPITVSGVGVRESSMVVLFAGVVAPHVVLVAGFTYSVATVIIFPLFCVPLTIYSLYALGRGVA